MGEEGLLSVGCEKAPQEGAGRELGAGLREGATHGNLALLSTYYVQPARLLSCITLVHSLIFTAKRVLFTQL